MNEALVIAIIGALGVVLAALFGVPRRFRNERDEINKDLVIYNALPPSSSMRVALLKRIDEHIDDFLIANRSVRRDFITAMVGIGLVSAAVAGAFLLHSQTGIKGPYLKPYEAGIYAVIMIGGFLLGSHLTYEGFQKKLRDEQGRIINKAKK